jgi:hypothetical protein
MVSFNETMKSWQLESNLFLLEIYSWKKTFIKKTLSKNPTISKVELINKIKKEKARVFCNKTTKLIEAHPKFNN